MSNLHRKIISQNSRFKTYIVLCHCFDFAGFHHFSVILSPFFDLPALLDPRCRRDVTTSLWMGKRREERVRWCSTSPTASWVHSWRWACGCPASPYSSTWPTLNSIKSKAGGFLALRDSRGQASSQPLGHLLSRLCFCILYKLIDVCVLFVSPKLFQE